MMHTAEMLKVFAPYREDAIVVPGRGGRYWTDLTARPNLDVPLGDPAMGGHAGFALGLALAQPQKKVMLFDSEGDILMSISRHISTISPSTISAIRRPAASRCPIPTTLLMT